MALLSLNLFLAGQIFISEASLIYDCYSVWANATFCLGGTGVNIHTSNQLKLTYTACSRSRSGVASKFCGQTELLKLSF